MTMPEDHGLAPARVPQAATVGAAALTGLVGLSMLVLPPVPAALATLLFGAAAGFVLFAASIAGLMWRFGAANAVTTVRLALGCLLAAALFDAPGRLVDSGILSAIALAALVLDGVDGWLARRFRTATEFGARFDMEVDAAVILVLSLLVWHCGRADAWVVAIGAMRYAFVAAGWALPWLRASLPPRHDRRVVCVLQVLALAFALAPGTADLASMAVAAALGLLTLSFARDTVWLYRRKSAQERN